MQRMMPCRFITFEGIDGSGKTSVAKAVTKQLKRRGVSVVLTTEPTHTWLGDAVKRSYAEPVSPFTEALLFLADRATHTEQIKRWVAQRKVVISDRYADSTYAYQAASLKGVSGDVMSWLRKISEPFVIEPDLTLLLDVPPRLGLARIQSRKKKVHFEEERFLRNVRANYIRLAKGRRFIVIDSSRSIKKVTEEALGIVSSRVLGPRALRR